MHWFKSKRHYPEFYSNYLDLINSRGFSDEITSLDMETSGLDPKSANILSFGCLKIKGGKIVPNSEIHHLFPTEKTTEENIVIHELLGNETADADIEPLPFILEQIGNSVILGHYVQFDIDLINRLLKNYNLPRLKNPRLDTLEMALRKDGFHDYQYASRQNYTLYALCERYGIEVEHTHDALSDAYLTSLLYFHLL